MRRRLLYIASVFVLVAVTALAASFVGRPKTLKIAVGPAGGSDLRVVVAFLQALQRDNAKIRLRLVLTDGAVGSAEALAKDNADLAVVRSDIAVPTSAATLAIMQRDAIYFVTRPGAGISKISDLRGKAVGMVSPRPANDNALTAVLTQYGLREAELRLTRGTSAEIGRAVSAGELDAVFIVAPLAGPVSRMAMQSFPKVEGEEPGLLPISEAEAIAKLLPAFDTIEILRGTFGGDPPRPEASINTLAVTHRLVASRDFDESLASELTRLLFSLRPSMVADAPGANQIELPITDDRGAKLPTHPGTIAYVEGETKTFFERFGDWIYIGIMGFSLVGSVAAALYSRVSSGRSPQDIDRDLADVGRLIETARRADKVEIASIRQEAERARADLVQLVIATGPDADKIAAIDFLLRELKDVLSARAEEIRESA